jgi:hypothetical protein
MNLSNQAGGGSQGKIGQELLLLYFWKALIYSGFSVFSVFYIKARQIRPACLTAVKENG